MGSRAARPDAANLRGDTLTQLSLSRIGAELLATYAHDRKSGVVRWSVQGKTYALEFSGGRPVRAIGASGHPTDDRAVVARTLRAFAMADKGELELEEKPIDGASDIDTLGELVLELQRGLTATQVAAIASSAPDVVMSPRLAHVSDAIAKLCGSAPGHAMAHDRATVIAYILGVLVPPPSPLVAEIDAAYAAMGTLDHYQFLGVARDATPDAIRKAYFERAKRWHSDRFAGVDLGDSRAKADALFRRADEAQSVLSDPARRSEYDTALERSAAGLPNDVRVLMEAEGLFHKAKIFVTRGQAAAAEPLLAQAIALNKGEAAYFAYHGYALFAAKGAAGAAEAREQIDKALAMNPNLDAAHTFLGMIARVEGKLPAAVKHLNQALELNPKNQEAERELRFVQSRLQKEKDKTPAPGLFGGLIKKKS